MPHAPPLGALLRQYAAGSAVACEPVEQGLLNRGYRLRTTRGRYFLKHHFDPETADPVAIARQHAATRRLADLGVPVAPPVPDRDGRTVAVVGGHAYALHPWIDGRHRHGGQLTTVQCGRLGALLGVVHASLERVMPGQRAECLPGADPADTFALIDDLLGHVRRHRPADAFDELARRRLLERRELLERHADRRPTRGGCVGWVHGDFHPFNLLYKGDAPAAIVDWDRLGVQPRAEEAVRAAAIFFVRPDGALDLPKVRAYAHAYRRAARATPSELAAAVHRVWWERLNDFWMLRWHYERGDTRADPQFPAASALAVWWTREYDAVCEAFTEYAP
ncbi:Ser/Thr protein kinase RdoA involved in Cpx stress response, MazF antagonist [Streptomyces sp. 3213]|uniref:phosphotransferase n=1 Tax=Streptomyces sp. 3213.3 TaxID=1855348 RepID=UPI000899C93A|nr:phosphotransferase [Streptomyces sp. 3213.3]SED98246.1 Ser/Thr protein kinase RdoA involved in Cpx stress response, MazF antagonist [Streptomyces sp. 3213] [Streptomyces sp. 3213.3]